MNNLIVVCGASGSGKSTWIKNHMNVEKDICVSRDVVRFSLVKEDEPYFSKENEVFKTFINEIKKALLSNDYRNIYVDATHLNRGSRTKLLRALGCSIKNYNVVSVVIHSTLETCIKQNENRAGTRAYVPETAITNMFHSFSFPEKEEGFNEVYVVTKEGVSVIL